MSPGGRELMEERARELARPREAPVAAGVVLLPFHAGGFAWAVEVSRVHQVLEAERLPPLLGARQPVVGAIRRATTDVIGQDPGVVYRALGYDYLDAPPLTLVAADVLQRPHLVLAVDERALLELPELHSAQSQRLQVLLD